MPLSDKVMNIFKKITIKSPKTGQDIKVSSALTSDDPLTKKVGVKKAKDIIRKAKDSKKEPQEKPKEKPNPEYEKAVKQAKDKAKKMAKDNPIVTQPIQDPMNYKYYYPGEEGHYRQTGFDPYGEFSVDKSDYETPQDSKTKVDGDGKDDTKKDMNRAADDEADDMDRDARFAADAEDGESPYNPKGMSSDDPMFYDPEKEMKRKKRLANKEAKQYVKENKEEVLKYVIKRIIKEELDAS